MLLIERHLLRQFAETVAAVAIILLLISLGGLFADLVQEIAKGKVPAGLLLSQLGLRSIRFLTLVLPLALFLGLMLSIGRLYADSEMTVLSAVGLGPQRLWRPLCWISVPVVAVIAISSLWLAPWSVHKGQQMIELANRSFLIAGLDPGRFVEIPGGGGVLYVSELSPDGTLFKRLFVQSEREGRLDIITARNGDVQLLGGSQRILRLNDGFRVEGALGAKDFRLMHFQSNEIRVPDREADGQAQDMTAIDTFALLADGKPVAMAEFHWRLAMPLFAGILALFALPLARSEPRQPQYGLILFAMLVYVVGMLLLMLGTALLDTGALHSVLGLWWVHLPMLALGTWLFWRDGRLPQPKQVRR